MILFGNTQNKLSYNPPSVVIGTQTWALQNFSESTLINGTVLTNVTDNSAWVALTTAAWCNYKNDPAIGAEYGKLYNWYCCALIDAAYNPYGWRVATQADFNTLITALGGTTVAGKALKESGTTHWSAGNTGDNSSEFTAFGGGIISAVGSFIRFNTYGYYLTSTEVTTNNCRLNYIEYNKNEISANISTSKKQGSSIRLIKI